ncbi:hypothetical protein EV649_5661 [Kribbella sp. VKM Ac-2569]|uniref:hypothetical protein n=1 Tax=Kribbella sp. VKM Ac-2569 TaxID=2512220 RepID=UPI00102BA92B|nr:hypothetical protein [Kribbella sp. VKM Ac-2569]RZT14881.1 hypothetical protein EV649_5661 [Kribbella sp. VKM Ac-2569]
MMRRRGAVHGDPRVIEVGLDELLQAGYERTEQDPDPDSDGDDADRGVDEWRADESGVSFGVAFFGWLVAGGIVVLLLASVGAVGTVIGWDRLAGWADSEWLAVSAWIVIVVALGIGAFSGGYAGGRMVPAHGGRQGLDVWLLSWGATAVIVGLGYVAVHEYDVVARIDWTSLPIAETDRTAAALVGLVAIVLVTLVSAVVGGAVGSHCSARLSRINQQHQAMP